MRIKSVCMHQGMEIKSLLGIGSKNSRFINIMIYESKL